MAHLNASRGAALLRASRALLSTVGLWTALGCGKLDRECKSVSATANAFIAESERLHPKPDATPEETVQAELRTAARYEKLASDLAALKIESDELAPDVERYRALAEHAAGSLRAVAGALSRGDFEAARAKRIELDREARGEAPLVTHINEVCGISRAKPDGS